MRDNAVCSDCTIINYTSGNFIFNVTGFSSYSAGSNSEIISNITNRYSAKLLYNETIYMLADYINRTGRESINGSNEYCNISVSGNSYPMEFNSTTLKYSYNSTFYDLGAASRSIGYNVSCYNGIGFENISYSSSFTVSREAVLLSKVEMNMTGLKESSLAVGDLNGDGLNDFVYSGQNEEASGILAFPLYIYMNNGTGLTLNQTMAGARDGSIGLVDYNKDGKLEIVIIGSKSVNTPDIFMYKLNQ